MDANSTYILKIATTKTINAFVSYSSVMTLRLCRDMTNQDGGIREELWNRSNRLLTARRGAESNQNFRSSIYASGDPIISYQIQISLASLIIQCY